MNKQNTILDFEDFLNSYKNKNYISGNEYVKQLFPLTLDDPLSEECAYLVGKIMGDGNLDPKFTIRLIGNEEDLKLLRNLFINKFKIDQDRISIRRKIAKGISYLLQVNCAYIGRILYLLGAPMGNKAKNAFNIPKWILANKTVTKRFLQALLEDELTTIKIRECNYSVTPRLKLAKNEKLIDNLNEFMQQVRQAINSFGIECSKISKPIKGIKTHELYFFIRGNKKNIIKFKEEIGFRLNQDKVRKLNICYHILKST